MKKLIRKLIGLTLLMGCNPAFADTPPQVINKQCSIHQWFSQIQPGPGHINCTQPTYADIGNALVFGQSITQSGLNVTLTNDSATPGNNKYYGTNGGGTRGYFDFTSLGNFITSLTTDVVANGPGAAVATIQPNVVSNSKLAQMGANTIKGNNTGITANAADLTIAQTNSMLGDLLANGTVPLTGNWGAGAFNITAGSFTSNNASGVGTLNANIGFTVTPLSMTIALTTTNGEGFSVEGAFPVGNTNSVTSFNANATSAAAAYTLGTLEQFVANNPPAGAGSTITRSIGFRAVPSTSATNNAMFADNASFIGNYFLNSSSANISSLGGGLILNGTAFTTSQIIRATSGSTTGMSAASQFGVYSDASFGVNATTEADAYFAQIQTTNSVFTTALASAYNAGVAAKGGSNTITRLVDFYGATQTAGINNAWGADNSSYVGNYVLNFTSSNPSVWAGSIQASNFSGSSSGANTGDVTLAAVGASANANAASLSGQILNLQPFSSSFPGVVLASGGGSSNFLRADGTWAAPAGTAGITALTGDVTATGPGSVPATLATVNANVGTFAVETVNGKGLVTAAQNLSGDATSSGAVLTLATVNANVGTFASATVNAKGLVTAAAALSGDATTSGSALTLATVATGATVGSSTSIPTFTFNNKGLVTSASGNAVIAPAGTLSGTILNATVVSSSLTSVGTIGTGVWQGTAIADGFIATPYIKADGTRALTANWAAGNFQITANSVLIGSASKQISQLQTIASDSSMTFQTNGSTTAGSIDTSQKWTIGASGGTQGHTINGTLSATASSAGDTSITLDNTNAASAAADADFISRTASGGGNPYMRFIATGLITWSHGVDRADSGKYKISKANALGSNDYFQISTAGQTTIGASGGTQSNVVNGGLTSSNFSGVGASNAFIGFTVTPASMTTALTTSNVEGFSVEGAFPVGGTNSVTAYNAAATTTASAYTLNVLEQFVANNPTKGAGSTITRTINYRSVNPTSATNNADIADNNSFTGSYFINSTSTNASVLGGVVAIGASSANPSVAFRITGNLTTGGSQRNIFIDNVFDSTATTLMEGVHSSIQSANASFTTPAAYEFYAAISAKGAANVITRLINYRGETQTDGTNNAFMTDNDTFTGNFFINSTDTRPSLISGDFKINTAGKGLFIKEGSNAKMGTCTLSAGSCTVSTTAVTASSRIFITVQSLGTVAVATPVAVTARSAGTSFTISSSSATDTSVIAWVLFEPA